MLKSEEKGFSVNECLLTFESGKKFNILKNIDKAIIREDVDSHFIVLILQVTIRLDLFDEILDKSTQLSFKYHTLNDNPKHFNLKFQKFVNEVSKERQQFKIYEMQFVTSEFFDFMSIDNSISQHSNKTANEIIIQKLKEKSIKHKDSSLKETSKFDYFWMKPFFNCFDELLYFGDNIKLFYPFENQLELATYSQLIKSKPIPLLYTSTDFDLSAQFNLIREFEIKDVFNKQEAMNKMNGYRYVLFNTSNASTTISLIDNTDSPPKRASRVKNLYDKLFKLRSRFLSVTLQYGNSKLKPGVMVTPQLLSDKQEISKDSNFSGDWLVWISHTEIDLNAMTFNQIIDCVR